MDISYSKGDELKIIEMTDNGSSYSDITKKLNRTYYGIYDKVKRMRDLV